MNLQAFEYYLKESGLAPRTISEHLKDIERFINWAVTHEYITKTTASIAHIRYNDLLSYVQEMKNKNLNVKTQNIRINSIRKYYEHLKEEGKAETNPARRLHIKGAIRKITHQPLSYTELEELYHQYSQPKEHYREAKHQKAHQRNNIILSLMIWQGVHSGELNQLEIEHVNMSEGTIYIPGTRRSNNRTLKLESKQIIHLHHYLTETNFSSHQLFEKNTHSIIYNMMNELKAINPVIKNAAHIRASVILHWLKMYNKREVQYMLGHRWISSTEHYEVQELTSLTDLLTKHHPFS